METKTLLSGSHTTLPEHRQVLPAMVAWRATHEQCLAASTTPAPFWEPGLICLPGKADATGDIPGCCGAAQMLHMTQHQNV